MEIDLDSINLEKSSQYIQILAVIDTNYVKNNYPNPSKNWRSPTGITSNALFMLNSRAPGVSSSEGTGDLSLRLNVGDKISLMATSLSDNSGDSAELYGIKRAAGDRVFSAFTTVIINQADAESAAETPDIIATSAQSQVFRAYSAIATSSGSEKLGTIFALYTRNQNEKTLFGYFYWTWQASAA